MIAGAIIGEGSGTIRRITADLPCKLTMPRKWTRRSGLDWYRVALLSSPFSDALVECAVRVVDALGKWSLIDAFVMVLFRVAFRFQLTTRDDDAWATVDVRVAPRWGFHAFVLATVVSLGVGHVARHCASGTGDAPNRPSIQSRSRWLRIVDGT